jgi:hypothetical protein
MKLTHQNLRKLEVICFFLSNKNIADIHSEVKKISWIIDKQLLDIQQEYEDVYLNN